MNNKEIFNNIYDNNVWIYKSGEGSDPENAKEWIDLVNSFIKEKNIKTILDLGCGDWRIGNCLNLENISYTGIEVSSIMFDEIKQNKKDNIDFINADILEIDYPEVDLIIIKDVLQHLSINQVSSIVNKIIKSSKYALISNDFNKDYKYSKTINNDVPTGDHFYLDLNSSPFLYNFENILDFNSGSQLKRVYLYTNNNIMI